MITSTSLATSLVQYGILGLQQGYPGSAIKSFTHALQHEPTFVCAIANRAIAYMHQGNESQALNDLSLALEFAPDQFALHFNRATIYSKIGKLDTAIADFQQAFHLDPDQFACCSNQQMILLLPSQEIENTDDLIESKMPISVARSGLYTHWLQYYLAACNGQLIEGLRQNEQVSDGSIPMKPHTSIPLNVLWQWILQSYAEQITQDPNNVLLYWDRSWLYGEMKAFDQAIADLTQAISLAPTNAVLWSNRGVMYYHAGDFNSALFDFNYSIGLNSKVADVFMNRAYVLFNLQCVDEALRDLTRANQLFS